MTLGKFTPQTGTAAGKKSGIRRLTLRRVEQELGHLETVDDAMRRLDRICLWALGGLLPGVVANAAVRSVEVWIRAKEAEASFEVVEALRADFKTVREERDQLARDLELARMGI